MTDSPDDKSNGVIRDKQGKFVKGTTGGPGTSLSAAISVAMFRRLIHECVTPDDIRKVLSIVIEKAIGGDMRATEILLDRLVGKVPQGLNVSLEQLLGPGQVVLDAAAVESPLLLPPGATGGDGE